MDKANEVLTPTINLGDQDIRPSQNPKTGLWRKLVKLTREQEEVRGLPTEEVLDEMEDLIIQAFKDKRVTKEALQEVDLEDFMPLFYNVSAWINILVAHKMEALAKIPNA